MKPKNQTLFVRATFSMLATIVATLVLWQPAFVSAQKADEPATQPGSSSGSSVARAHPFEPTEELVYVAEFSRALLKKVDVADFRFTASKQTSLQKVSDPGFAQEKGGDSYLLKFTGDVSSRGFFARLFNLRFREQIESIVEPATFTVRKTKRIDQQGKRERVSETVYGEGKMLWVERDPNNPSRPARSAEATFVGQLQDVLSAIYFLRTQPLEVGRDFEVTVSDSGLVYKIPVHVIEKKNRKSVLGRVETLRVEPEVFGPNRLISGDGQFSIWITNDRRRVPVAARIKMRYGTFDITLRKVNRNPSSPESLAATKSGN